MTKTIKALVLSFVLLTACQTAFAAGIESLISPGPLSELHADLEGECSSCHETFDQGAQTRLCADCHEEIAEDIATGTQFHGKHPIIKEAACRDCHTEHEGRDKDITGLVRETFDHSLTEFTLLGAHATLDCAGCHKTDVPFRGTDRTCIGCHEEDDAHDGGLGTECANCHEETGWAQTTFDHAQETEYALIGAHESEPCQACHIDNKFEGTPTACVDCHRLDDVHKGARGDACDQCHSTVEWADSAFDHGVETDFTLLGKHSELSCSSCHLENMSLPEPPTTCAGCHSTDDVHRGARGDQCQDCHNNNSWSVEFDHEQESGFALLGAHNQLQCESCHTGSLTDPLPTNCAKCHAEDDPHAETLGACDSCHSNSAWVKEIRFDHEFTNFPLVGFHQLLTCDECHSTQVFNEAPSVCIDCHRKDDKHENTFGESCGSCHSPGGWELWSFDHSTQTRFALSGAHQDLICASCHRPETGSAENLSTECINCHLGDDIHTGQFGRDCARCHTSENFADTARVR